MTEKYGRCATMLFASVPLTAGLILQGFSTQLRTSVFISVGRLLHSFGATWLLVGGTVFATDVLIPRIKQQTLYSILNLSLAACFLLVHVMGLPQVLGTLDLWPLLHGVAGGGLLFLLTIVVFVPEPPRYLELVSEKLALHDSLHFYYIGAITTESYKMYILSQKFWTDAGQDRQALTRKESYSIREMIEKKKLSSQMKHVYLIIVCEILKHVILSSAILMFSATALREGMGFQNGGDFINYVIIGAFFTGILGAFVGLRLGKSREKMSVRVSCMVLVILAFTGLTGLGFLRQFFITKSSTVIIADYTKILELSTFFLLFILFAAYNLSLATLAKDVACERFSLIVSQIPAMTLAGALARTADFFIASAFLPALRLGGPGFAWLVILFPLIICSLFLLLWLPKGRRQISLADAKISKIPLLIYPDKSPGSPTYPSGSRPRSSSFSNPARRGDLENMQELRKPMERIGRPDTKRMTSEPVGKSRSRARSASPGALRKKAGLYLDLSKISLSAAASPARKVATGHFLDPNLHVT